MKKEKEKATKKKTNKVVKSAETKVKKNKIVEEASKKEEKVVVAAKDEPKEKKTDKKERKMKKEKGPGVFKSIGGFFKGVGSEMSKVVWPTKRDMVKYSIATIVFILFFALYFFGIESLWMWLKSSIVIV